MWRNDIYERAVKNHRDDLYMLMDAGVVADCLVSMGVFSSSDSDDVSSADNRCACLLAKIAEKQVYHHFFSTLLQTGHEKLWDILSRACEGKFKLEQWCSTRNATMYHTRLSIPLQTLIVVPR